MKLLLDFNLSPKLVGLVADFFPQTVHAANTGLSGQTPDKVIWDYARENNFIVLTCDLDFVQLSRQYGYPPKVIRLEGMNFRTRAAADLIIGNLALITEFEQSNSGLLVLRFGSH